MPKAYLIANIQVQDRAAFEQYRDAVAPMIGQFGGRYLIRGGTVTPVEGEPGLHRVVVLEFPDMAALQAFYRSPDYQPLLKLRLGATISHTAMVEGYDGG